MDAVAAVILDGLSYRRAGRMVGISKTEVGDSLDLLLGPLAALYSNRGSLPGWSGPVGSAGGRGRPPLMIRCVRTEDQTVAAGHSVAPARWQAGLDELLGRVARRFPRVEPRRHAWAFVLGLLADLPGKNCWTIAEHAGDATPDGMQHLLARAVWDEDGVRDDVRAYVVEHLGDPQAVLVVDETGDLKKGTATVGVQRQYTGTAGRVENAQVAVYLVYATDAGHALIDRELYLPQGWIDDPERCQAAGVPAQVGLPPSRPWPPACSPGRWTPGCRLPGWPAMRSTAPAPLCGPAWKTAASATCWRSPATTAWSPAGRLPCRRPAQACPSAGLAVHLGRQGRQGPSLLRLGVRPPGWRR